MTDQKKQDLSVLSKPADTTKIDSEHLKESIEAVLRSDNFLGFGQQHRDHSSHSNYDNADESEYDVDQGLPITPTPIPVK